MEDLNEKTREPLSILKNDENILIQELYEHGANKAKQKDKYSCVYCSSSDALSLYRNKNNEINYKCFSCGEYGDVVSLVMNKEGKNFIESLKYLCDKNNIPLELGSSIHANRAIKAKVVDYYNKKSEKALKEGNFDEAFKYSCEADRQTNSTYYIQFPFLDSRNNPLKVWDNVEAILEDNNIHAFYNAISKEVNIEGLDVDDFDSQVMDIHSLCHKYGLKVTLDFLVKSINRYAAKNSHNPVVSYLEKCEFLYDGEGGYIDRLCDTLITKKDYDQDLKKLLIRKWLFNTAYIAFNEGDLNTEGCLVLQGPQGCGKTSFIKCIIPKEFLKTGLDINPDDKDSLRKATKYWVVELGELDATMKADQAKLKAFITESVDEYRLPYAISSKRYPRTTSLFGTVNKEDFLKDETGSRRFWIIPVEQIKLDELKEIDIEQLWGEVMTELPDNINKLNLNAEELKLLAANNEEFNVKGNTEIVVEAGFAWDSDPENWIFLPTSEIAHRLGLKSTSGLRTALTKMGAEYQNKRYNGKRVRGYTVPPFMTVY